MLIAISFFLAGISVGSIVTVKVAQFLSQDEAPSASNKPYRRYESQK